MTERVIHEVRIIETEDGFRVEVKGDKERMRRMGFGPGFPFGLGAAFGFGMGFGPARFRHRMRRRWGFGPWGCWWEEPEEEAEGREPESDKPSEDR